MKEGKVKSSNKGLVVLLCVLLVAIVGLGVGVFVVFLNSGFDEEFTQEVDYGGNGPRAYFTGEIEESDAVPGIDFNDIGEE